MGDINARVVMVNDDCCASGNGCGEYKKDEILSTQRVV